jgi:hypothetical protein
MVTPSVFWVDEVGAVFFALKKRPTFAQGAKHGFCAILVVACLC